MSLTNMNGLPFIKKKFSANTKKQAINSLSYGMAVKYGSDKHSMIIYQSEVDVDLLILLPKKGDPPTKLETIELRKIIDIQEQVPSQAEQGKVWIMIEEKPQKHYFLFPDENSKNLFWQAVQILIENSYLLMQQNMKVDYVKQMALDMFSKGDQDLSDNLTHDEGYSLLQKLNINVSKKDLIKKFKEYDDNNDNLIQVEEFIKIARDLLQKNELKPIFGKYARSFKDTTSITQPIMKKEEFFEFMRVEQKQEELDSKTQTFLAIFFMQRANLISYSDFVNLVFNHQNNIYDPAKLNVYQSMDQPLTDYFINSSHNTYLMANQLTGDSSVQAYINTFRKGGRCIEIDAWDGNEPMVTHGFTLTSSIKFKDIINTIKVYGFAWSKYPIIISIENHCNKENQKKMALIMKETFGNSLYLIPDDYSDMKYYPSPRQLKRKIIVKAKGSLSKILKDIVQQVDTLKLSSAKSTPNPPTKKLRDSILCTNYQEDQIPIYQIYHMEQNYSENSTQDSNNLLDANNQLLTVSESLRQLKSLQTFQTQKSEIDKEIEESDDESHKQKVLQVKDFQRCISMVGIHFSMDIIRYQSASIFDIFSLSEEKIHKILEKHEDLIVDYHKKYFSRIYPKGSRVDSSNYDPFPSFASGSQIIALNFQTCDYPLFMYLSKFQQNGGIYSGYVLKPRFLRHLHPDNIDRSNHNICDEMTHQLKHSVKYPSQFTQPTKEIRITILSGQCLKRDEDDSKQFNPYVEVALKGTEFDEKNNKTQKTKTISNNTFHPIFNSTPIVFQISCPELAMVSFQIFSNDLLKNELFAQYALDFRCIREGYRIIPLWDKDLQVIQHGMLFAHISINNI